MATFRTRDDFHLTVKPGWVVERESRLERQVGAFREWRESHSGFEEWTSTWLQREFIDKGTVVAENSCTDIMVFNSREAAKKFAERDAAISSGARAVKPCLYVRVPMSDKAAERDEAADYVREIATEVAMSEGAVGVLFNADVIIFHDSQEGRREIESFAEALGVENQVEW
jgi:hypothetical protein